MNKTCKCCGRIWTNLVGIETKRDENGSVWWNCDCKSTLMYHPNMNDLKKSLRQQAKSI